MRLVISSLMAVSALRGQTPPHSLHEFSNSLEKLSDKVRLSVVQVYSVGYAPVEDRETGGSGAAVVSKQRSTGSGIVFTQDGYIVTNAHVIQGSKRIQVKLASAGRRSTGDKIDAKLIGLDHDTDLAVIKVERTGLQPLVLGNSDDLKQGQVVLAFGNPFGLEGSVSMGIVSSTTRQIRTDDSVAYIQTDAPINPGNSGGPLVDDMGRMVGVNTLILSASGVSEGVGFAIPSNLVQAIFTQLRKDGHVRRGQIGVYAQTVTPALVAGLGLPESTGVVVSDIEPGSPADRAGITVGDMILAADGHPVEDIRQLNMTIFKHALNDTIHLEILRGKQHSDVAVAITERNDDPQRFAEMASNEENLVNQLGTLCVTLDKKLAQLLPDLREPNGVVVAALSPDANPEGTGLEAGDVIHGVNGNHISSVDALKKRLKEFSSGDSVVLQIERDSRLMFLTVDVE